MFLWLQPYVSLFYQDPNIKDFCLLFYLIGRYQKLRGPEQNGIKQLLHDWIQKKGSNDLTVQSKEVIYITLDVALLFWNWGKEFKENELCPKEKIITQIIEEKTKRPAYTWKPRKSKSVISPRRVRFSSIARRRKGKSGSKLPMQPVQNLSTLSLPSIAQDADLTLQFPHTEYTCLKLYGTISCSDIAKILTMKASMLFQKINFESLLIYCRDSKKITDMEEGIQNVCNMIAFGNELKTWVIGSIFYLQQTTGNVLEFIATFISLCSEFCELRNLYCGHVVAQALFCPEMDTLISTVKEDKQKERIDLYRESCKDLAGATMNSFSFIRTLEKTIEPPAIPAFDILLKDCTRIASGTPLSDAEFPEYINFSMWRKLYEYVGKQLVRFQKKSYEKSIDSAALKTLPNFKDVFEMKTLLDDECVQQACERIRGYKRETLFMVDATKPGSKIVATWALKKRNSSDNLFNKRPRRRSVRIDPSEAAVYLRKSKTTNGHI